jgi:Na+/H+-dicarboxylate symporter
MIQEVSKSKTRSEAVTELLVFILVVLISTFFLRIAWNRSLVKHISILKPIKTMGDALVLALSIQVLRGL